MVRERSALCHAPGRRGKVPGQLEHPALVPTTADAPGQEVALVWNVQRSGARRPAEGEREWVSCLCAVLARREVSPCSDRNLMTSLGLAHFPICLLQHSPHPDRRVNLRRIHSVGRVENS